MKHDIILAGVGGQGILSIAFIIDNTALRQGYWIKQAEVHGMAQRGGAVYSYLRISDSPIHSDLIPEGSADMILSIEPLEALRYVDFLSSSGWIISSSNPNINIPDYPPIKKILTALSSFPRHHLIDARTIGRKAGSIKTQNIVLLGAASNFLPLDPEIMEGFIVQLFRKKGKKIVEINLDAFKMGKETIKA